MPQYATKGISSKLQARFGLQSAAGPGSLALDDKLYASVDVGDLFRVPTFYVVHAVPVGGTGLILCKQVPAGKRWVVKTMRAEQNSGTFTMDQFMAATPDLSNVILAIKTAATAINYVVADGSFTIDQSWWLGVDCGVWSVAGTIDFKLYVEEVDIA